MQSESQLGDDPQRAFGTYEQLLEIVARVILYQCALPVPDASVRQDDFDAEHLFARGTEAKHIQPAAIRRDRATNGGCPARTPVGSEYQTLRGDRFLQDLHNAARFYSHGAACSVDIKNVVHPGQRQKNRWFVLGRDSHLAYIAVAPWSRMATPFS